MMMRFSPFSSKKKQGARSPPGTADGDERRATKMAIKTSNLKDDNDAMNTVGFDIHPSKVVNRDNFFNNFITGKVDAPDTKYISSHPNNTLSEEAKKLPSAKAIEQEVINAKYTTFMPVSSLSSNPKKHVTGLKFKHFPPDDISQDLGKHGTLSTRVLTGVGVDGEDLYTFHGTAQNPSINAVSTADNRIIGRKFDISERKAQIATNESTAYFDIHPFLGPFNQAEEDKKNTPIGIKYIDMRKKFDRLVMEHIIQLIGSDLLSSLEFIIIYGDPAWEFFTVDFPREFPNEYETVIRPLIIQHSPLVHGTILASYNVSNRQGYNYCEAVSNYADHLCGKDYSRKLIGFDFVANIFCFGKTSNDGREGDDHFVYIARFEDYGGDGDNTVFVGRNYTHLQQLMKDAEDGMGFPSSFPNQELLRKGSQKLESIQLTIEIKHFFDLYKLRERQMTMTDWGVQNRDTTHKAWKDHVTNKRNNETGEVKMGIRMKRLNVFNNWRNK